MKFSFAFDRGIMSLQNIANTILNFANIFIERGNIREKYSI